MPPTDPPTAVDAAKCPRCGQTLERAWSWHPDEACDEYLIESLRDQRDRYAEDALGFMAKADSLSEQLAAAREEAVSAVRDRNDALHAVQVKSDQVVQWQERADQAREEARIEWEATRETLAHAEQDREELTQQRDAAREEAQKWSAYATRLAKRVDVVERRLADRGDELDAALAATDTAVGE